MTVSMTGEPLVGPTYAVPSVSCRGREVDSRGETVLFVRVGAEEDLQRVPARAVSEDSEVLDVGDQGTLVLLESVARRLGWVEEERAAGSCIANNPLLYNSALSNIEALRANQRRTFLEVRALADAAAERRLDKLPCTREGAKTALSLTFQVWAEWQDPSPYPLFPDPIETCALDGKTRPEVGLLFLEWVRGLLPGILAECLPDAPSSGASAGSMNVDPTDAGQVRAAVLSGAPVFLGHDANANPTAHVVKVARAIQRELKKGESNGELYSTCSELEDEVERLTAVLADRDRNHEEQWAALCEGIERYKSQRNAAEDELASRDLTIRDLRADLSAAVTVLDATLRYFNGGVGDGSISDTCTMLAEMRGRIHASLKPDGSS